MLAESISIALLRKISIAVPERDTNPGYAETVPWSYRIFRKLDNYL
jgi:hypothetical protein